MEAEWQERWLHIANEVGQWSKDKSTKVGCVIVGTVNQVLSLGYNGFPRGIDDEVQARHERPAKYAWTEHAERNAFYNAARFGVSLAGGTLVVTANPALYPCADCARGIIQTGIVAVVCDPPDYDHPKWGEQFKVTDEMLTEAGVLVSTWSWK